jgi:hypothetical protein
MEVDANEQRLRAEGKRRAQGEKRWTLRRRKTVAVRLAGLKKAVPKEGEVRLVMQLTAGDWAWWRRRRWETPRAMAGDDDRAEAARTGLVAGRKRKWAEVLTLHGLDCEDDDPSEREQKQCLMMMKRMKVEAEFEAEAEAEVEADPTTRLNPMLDQCHITTNN